MISGFAVTDLHVHIQPWEMHPAPVHAALEAGRSDLDRIRAFVESPREFLLFLDACGIERAAIINYVSPDVMGFTPEVNAWCARYCAHAPDRLIGFGSVHPRFTRAPFVGHKGWVSMDATGVSDWEKVRALIFESYRLIAPKRSLAKYVGSESPGSKTEPGKKPSKRKTASRG